MMIIGFGFKAAVAPFHVWTPDVYEGAPTPITGFMAAGPKAAAFASFVRVFVLGFPLIAGAHASGLLHQSWVSALSVLAIITMFVGNVAAILQDNVKRMLAYSSIAHAGYAMVGFVGAGVAATTAARDEAVAAVAFYMLTYAVTNLGAFAIVTLFAQRTIDAATLRITTASGSALRCFHSHFRCSCCRFSACLLRPASWVR